MDAKIKFHQYFKQWMQLYKLGAVREITYQKYQTTYKRLVELEPDLQLSQLNRHNYQKLLNDYASTHEKRTTMNFHHHLKGAIYDAIEEKLMENDPTRKIVVKGVVTKRKKKQYLSQSQVQKLLNSLDLNGEINFDYLIFLIAKTGLRFAEALALTPSDFDLNKLTINVNKSWDYKSSIGKFIPTKNISSNRKIQIDWKTMMEFTSLLAEIPNDNTIFVKKGQRIFNSTGNQRLEKLCEDLDIPIISIHGLRHTHASLLIYAGVSTSSVARRLGHANMTTTQNTYLHIIHELENQDNDKIMRYLTTLV